ncbi:MAG: hypothetical protein J6W76_01690 [Spirochaetales bacterium]|nr:hypothetical protein [Spirochaetales bacterium]
MQFIVDKTGYPIMIDPCRRAPGDLYMLLAKYTTDVDYPMEIVKAETGLGINDAYRCSHNFVARQCIMSDKNGVIDNIYIPEDIRKYIIDSNIWGKSGDKILDFMKYKAGILLMKFSNYKEMTEKLKDFHKLIKIEVK